MRKMMEVASVCLAVSSPYSFHLRKSCQLISTVNCVDGLKTNITASQEIVIDLLKPLKLETIE